MALRAASGVANEADNCYYQMLSDPLQIKRAKKEPFFLFSFVMSERWYFMMFCGAAAWCQYRLHYRVCTGEDLNIKIWHGIGNLICYLCIYIAVFWNHLLFSTADDFPTRIPVKTLQNICGYMLLLLADGILSKLVKFHWKKTSLKIEKAVDVTWCDSHS